MTSKTTATSPVVKPTARPLPAAPAATSDVAAWHEMLPANLTHRGRFIDACVEAGFNAADSATCWDGALEKGIAGMVELAHSMTGHGASCGGTDERRRVCSLAAFLVLNEVRDMMRA
jgi:hypothetical protein